MKAVKEYKFKLKNPATDSYVDLVIRSDSEGILTYCNLPIVLDKRAIQRDEKKEKERKEASKIQGVETEVRNGVTHITKVSPEVVKRMDVFRPDKPCWFDGCEEIRAEYLSRLEELGGSECPGCKKGSLQRELLPRIQTLIHEHTKKNNTTTS